MNQAADDNPATVPTKAKQAGEVRARWAWAEPSVWTDRMLTALEQGVQGGIWFSLIDKVHAPANLFASYAKVAANGGASGVDHVTVEDFTKQLARNLEKLAAHLKDGIYRPQQVRRVNIPKPGTKETRPLGIPTVRDRVVQGAVLSPLLSNLYLNELDHHMARSGYEMTRYADDLVIQCLTREEAERALALVQAWTTQAGLTLHPTKTKIVDAETDGFDFLGYRFVKHRRFPRRKSLAKFRDAIRAKTRRTAGRSLNMIVTDVNRTLRGWFEYFKHSNRSTFPELDAWIRMRLRSILRKRQGRSGRGRGADHHRWPNAYFAKQGLFNLTTTHDLVSQSCRR
jgi:hypothetical protein